MPSEIIGRVFGELRVIDKRTSRNASGNPIAYITVQCSCGKIYETGRGNVVRAKHPMCKDCAGWGGKGEDGQKHPLYRVWRAMLNRCGRPKNQNYKHYGARGIKVGKRWRGALERGEVVGSMDGFKNFVADMGPKPSTRHSLDRIDNDGNYKRSNCRWATPEQQRANQRRA